MEVVELQRSYIQYNASLVNEGYFDSQLAQMQQLQACGNPGFVSELADLYYISTERILNELTIAMNQQPIDFKKMYNHAHQLKGGSASLGAQRVRDATTAFRRFCEEQNTDGCMRALLELKQEYPIVKDKLQNLLTLERQILEAGGAIPVPQ